MSEVGMKTCRKYSEATRKSSSISETSIAVQTRPHCIPSYDQGCARYAGSRKSMKVSFPHYIALILQDVCESCRDNPSESAHTVSARSQSAESRYWQLQAICADCCAIPVGEDICCDSRDCPVFYSRLKSVSRLEEVLTRDAQLLESIE
jgi:hypothetical protein